MNQEQKDTIREEFHNFSKLMALASQEGKLKYKDVETTIADWLGAGRAYEGIYPDPKNWTWYINNRDRIFRHLHPATKNKIIKIISKMQSIK